jgi:hypothetical protein
MWRRSRAMLLGLVTILGPGCSFLFVHPADTTAPPGAPPLTPQQLAGVSCTESVASPVIDVVLGSVLFAAGTVMLVYAVSCSSSGGGTLTCPSSTAAPYAVAAGLGLPGLLLGGSSVYGFVKTHQCRSLHQPPPAAPASASAPSLPLWLTLDGSAGCPGAPGDAPRRCTR